MAVLYNAPAQQYNFIQLQVGRVIDGPWRIHVKFQPDALNDIRIRCFLFYFRSSTGTELTEPSAVIQARLNTFLNGVIVPFESRATDLIRILPLYDTDQLVIETTPDPSIA